MAKETPNHKKIFTQKLLEFQKNGLEQYGKYLDQQLKIASKMKSSQLYKKYIEQQIVLKDKNIKKIEDKLKSL
jgi:hypothetical protein